MTFRKTVLAALAGISTLAVVGFAMAQQPAPNQQPPAAAQGQGPGGPGMMGGPGMGGPGMGGPGMMGGGPGMGPMMGMGPGGGRRMARQMWQHLDKDGDGNISKEEFRAERLAKFDLIDTNHDVVVTTEELDAYILQQVQRMRARIMGQLDANADGKIQRAEVEKQMDNRFGSLDANHDGRIERREMMRQMRGQMRGEGGMHGRRWGGDAN